MNGDLDIDAIVESVARARCRTSTADRVLFDLRVLPIGICHVSRAGIIEHIDGGAIEEVGTARREWLGVSLIGTDYEGYFHRALAGERLAFIGTSQGRRDCTEFARYQPWESVETGEITGVLICWMVTFPGQRLELHDAA